MVTSQAMRYALLTLGEVLVSAASLDFAYSRVPQAMKGVILASWSLSVALGNQWVLVVNVSMQNTAGIDFIKSGGFGLTAFGIFFAAFAFAAALAFGLGPGPSR